MNNELKSKTVGREPSCTLVVEHPSVSRLHAHIQLADDGLVFVLDVDSRNGTFLNRNDSWIRVRRVTLCVGDRIRFGEVEVTLEHLTGVFGNLANTRLEARHFPLRDSNNHAKSSAQQVGHGALLQKPKRNPATGKIEEDQPN